VFGIAGVLQPRAAVVEAEIDTALAWLGRRGIQVPELRALTLGRYNGGERAPLDCSLRSLGIRLAAFERFELQVALRSAVPAATGNPRPWLRSLQGRCHLGLLDAGPGARLDTWVARLGLGDVAERQLWTEDLGAAAAPPRRLAFRWWAARCDARPQACLYVAGRADLAAAARHAGWRVIEPCGGDTTSLDEGFERTVTALEAAF